jgi:hypothetical protein
MSPYAGTAGHAHYRYEGLIPLPDMTGNLADMPSTPANHSRSSERSTQRAG